MQRHTFLFVFLALAIHTAGQSTSPGLVQPAVPLPDWVLNPTPTGRSTSVPSDLQKKADILEQLRASVDPKDKRDAPQPFRSQALASAKAKVKSNDLAGAEDFLTFDNPFEPGTAYWHLDTAQKWQAVAQDLSREKDRTKVPTVVARTLQHLEQAASRAQEKGDVSSQVTAKTSAAFLHERFRGDAGSAIASYKAALQLQPSDQPSREALERLERSVANLQARARGGKR